MHITKVCHIERFRKKRTILINISLQLIKYTIPHTTSIHKFVQIRIIERIEDSERKRKKKAQEGEKKTEGVEMRKKERGGRNARREKQHI